MSTVAIIEASYEDCHVAIERIFNLFPLDLEGKKVVIKPNVLRSATPEEGVTTHPAVLKAIVNEVVKRIQHRLSWAITLEFFPTG